MNVPPFFSVLVPVYNAGRWLVPCIESVLGQTDGDFELLLVDDGSTDPSGAVCDEYAARDARIRAFHQENAGQLAARVTALKHHRGEYCVFLDADDTLVPHALETLRKAVEDSGADCVVYGIRWDRPGGVEHLTTPASLCHRLITDRREALLHLLSDDAYNSVCRKCARSSCFDGRDLSAFYHIRSGEDKIQSMEIQGTRGAFTLSRTSSTSTGQTTRASPIRSTTTAGGRTTAWSPIPTTCWSGWACSPTRISTACATICSTRW